MTATELKFDSADAGKGAAGADKAAAGADKAAAGVDKAAAKAQARAVKAAGKVAEAQSRSAMRAEKSAGKQQRKTSAAESKHHRSESAASRKASKAAGKAAKAAAKASEAQAAAAATRPARLLQKATDPKIAKRAVTIGKIIAPAVAPVLLKAVAGARGAIDASRARRLGVSVDQVAAFRGPTGPAGARITGLTDAVRELAGRKGNDLQITRFAEVAGKRLADLTAAVQASATMPRARRTEVLRAVGRELDEIDADLVTHLMAPPSR